MNNRNKDLNQADEGDLLRDEVSDGAVEAAASVATGGLPLFGIALIASCALLGRRSAAKLLSKDEAHYCGVYLKDTRKPKKGSPC
jgi:hypothetical protein